MRKKDVWIQSLQFGIALFLALIPAIIGAISVFVGLWFEKHIKKRT